MTQLDYGPYRLEHATAEELRTRIKEALREIQLRKDLSPSLAMHLILSKIEYRLAGLGENDPFPIEGD